MVSQGRIGVNAVCRLFGLSKKTYYRSISPQESLNRRYQGLRKKIGKIIEDNPGYGYRRIQVGLEEQYEENVNHKLLLKLLKLWALTLPRKIRKPKRNWVQQVLDFLEIRANLLRAIVREGNTITLFQIIVTDVTEIHFGDGKAYLCVHLDYSGKMVYGWELRQHPNRDLVISSFDKMIISVKKWIGKIPEGMIVHQDKGSVYTSADYVSAVMSQHCRISYSRTGEPGDNAVNESFFSRLKEEWRDVFSEAKTFEELQCLVTQSIDYYNNRRYHSSIGMKSPRKYTQEMTLVSNGNLS